MDSALIAKILAFVLYLAVMVVIGLRSAGKNKSSSDFFLGGRKLGPWVTALSAEASDSSAWLLMGLPGLCYVGGFKETFWTALGLVVGTYLAWLIIAKPLRKCSIAFGDSITIPEFFENRFNDKTHVLSIVSVFFIVLFFTFYTASGFVACATLFDSVFHLPKALGILIGFVIILSYTILGGYRAVCSTDFIQGVLIFVAFVITSVIIISLCTTTEGLEAGFKDFFAKLFNSDFVDIGKSVVNGDYSADSVNQFGTAAVAGEFGEKLQNSFNNNSSFSVMSIVSAFSWCLGYFGMPHIIVRFMGIRSNAEIKQARRVGIIWMIVAYIGAFIIGYFGTAYLQSKGIILNEGNHEAVFSATMNNMFPAFIAGIFLCAILAAAMSTADSQLLSASSAIGQDIFKGLIKKDASEKTVLLVSRIAVFAIALIALIPAFISIADPNSSIFSLVSFAWSGFGGTFGALVILALFWKRTTNIGAIAGLVLGGIMDFVWHQIPATVHPVFGLYEILPAFITTLVVTVIVSLCTKKDPVVQEKFEHFKNMPD